MIYVKVTSRESYKVVRAMLRLKRFTQYKISNEEGVTFSLVNRVVNWFVSRGFVAKREGAYALVAPSAIFGLFPLYRKMVSIKTFEIGLKKKEAIALLKGKGALCLTSALEAYDDYYRDPVVYAYALDEKLIEDFADLPKGLTRVEFFKEDLNEEDLVKKGQWKTDKARTAIDLFCYNKAYAAERLLKKEWG